jgi:hypothetical protein
MKSMEIDRKKERDPEVFQTSTLMNLPQLKPFGIGDLIHLKFIRKIPIKHMIANGTNTMDANIMDALPIKTITLFFSIFHKKFGKLEQ